MGRKGRTGGGGRRGRRGRGGGGGRTGRSGRMGRSGFVGTLALAVAALFMSPRLAYPAPPAQVPFEEAAKNLTSADRATRLRAVQLLKETTYPEAAIPLIAAVTDADDAVQLEAIAAGLNIFLADPGGTRKRAALRIQ